METFRRLPSGNWHLTKYDFTDENGKRHYRSFTARTKAEIRQMVDEWKDDRPKRLKAVLSVSDALQGYLDTKADVLSPSTLRGYETIKRNFIDQHQIGRIQLNRLDTKTVQKWISEMAATHQPKTVRNAYGLLASVMAFYCPEMRFSVTLPQRKKPRLYCPNNADIAALLETIRRAGDAKMLLAVMLAAFIPARRSEIAALTYADIHGDRVTIDKAVVHDADGSWIVKGTKNTSSTRTVQINQFVIDLIGEGDPDERIIDLSPDSITEKFAKYIKLAGVPSFRFHDLRHYGLSMLALTMSERYLQDRGGWSSPNVMNSVYNNVIDMEKSRQTKEALKMFDQFK